jgi:cobalt/nickel transport system permease protein
MSGLDLAIVDYWATSGRSIIHRAGPACKVIMAGCFVAAAIVTEYLPLLPVLYLAVVGVLAAARVPPLKVMALAAYPLVFVALFVVSAWNGTWQMPALVFGRALTASLALVAVLATTPYHRVFGLLSRVLPRIVGEALFLTYRSVFILVDMAGGLVTATRVRSGLRLRHPVTNLRNLSLAMGRLLIHAMDRSERQYDIMVVRGYSGNIAGPARAWNSAATDAGPIILGAAALAAAIITRWTG